MGGNSRNGILRNLHPADVRHAPKAACPAAKLRTGFVRIEHGDMPMSLAEQKFRGQLPRSNTIPGYAKILFITLSGRKAAVNFLKLRKAFPSGSCCRGTVQNHSITAAGVEVARRRLPLPRSNQQQSKAAGFKLPLNSFKQAGNPWTRQKTAQQFPAWMEKSDVSCPHPDPLPRLWAGTVHIRHISALRDCNANSRSSRGTDPPGTVEIVRYRTHAHARQPGDIHNRHACSHSLPGTGPHL